VEATGYLRLRPQCDGPISVALDGCCYTQAAAAYYARLCGVPIAAVITAHPPLADASPQAASKGYGSDGSRPGLERLAYEFSGRDAGRLVEAAKSGPCGISTLLREICPPDFVQVDVGPEQEEAARAWSSQRLCKEACRALAAANGALQSSGLQADMPMLIVAPRQAAGSSDQHTGVASTRPAVVALKAKRTVLVSSAMSVREFLEDNVPAYAPLSVPGPQAVAGLNHLKRLGPRARDRAQV